MFLRAEQMNAYFEGEQLEVSQDVVETLNLWVTTFFLRNKAILDDINDIRDVGNEDILTLFKYNHAKQAYGVTEQPRNKMELKKIYDAYIRITTSEAAKAKAKAAAIEAAPVAAAPVDGLKQMDVGFRKDDANPRYYGDDTINRRYYSSAYVPAAPAAAPAAAPGFAFAFLGMPAFMDKMATSSVSIPKPVVAGVGTVLAIGALAMIAFGIAFATGDVSGFEFFAKLSFNAIVTASAVTAGAGLAAGVAKAIAEKKAAATGAPLVITAAGTAVQAAVVPVAAVEPAATTKSKYFSFGSKKDDAEGTPSNKYSNPLTKGIVSAFM